MTFSPFKRARTDEADVDANANANTNTNANMNVDDKKVNDVPLLQGNENDGKITDQDKDNDQDKISDPSSTDVKPDPVDSNATSDKQQQEAQQQEENAKAVLLLKFLLFDKLQMNKASTVEQALIEVVQIIAGHRGNCKRFYRLSGHCVLVLAMKKWTHHNNHQAIQRLCFCAVLHMAFQLPMKRTVFFEMGTMECIVKIMKNTTTGTTSSGSGSKAVDLHTYGLGALSNLFSAEVIPASQKAATLFVHDLNGLALIVNSMSQFHRESEEIQQLGCLLLMNLSKHGNFKDYMLDADVLCAVSSAKTLYKDNEKINKWGSACCHYLFDG